MTAVTLRFYGFFCYETRDYKFEKDRDGIKFAIQKGGPICYTNLRKERMMSKKRIIGGIVGILVGIAISLAPVPEMLNRGAMVGLGILIWGLIWMVTGVIKEYAAVIAMSALWAAFQVVPFGTAFAAFSGTNFWLLLGAIGMGVAVAKCGLLKRITFRILSIFPASFRGQMMAIMVSGTIISPLIPSGTAKAALGGPLVSSISDSIGFQRKSKGAGGLFAAYHISWLVMTPVFLSSSFLGYTVLGLLPEETAAEFTWVRWFICALPWSVFVLVVCGLVFMKLYKPEEDKRLDPSYIKGKIEMLGPWSRDEKACAAVLVVCLLMWMTESIHGIDAAVVALVALVIFIGLDIMNTDDFRKNIAWDSLILITALTNVGTVISAVNLDTWIGNMLGGYITPLISTPVIFVPILCILVYLVRFVIASWVAVMTIFIVLLSPFALEAGMDPWIIGMILYASVNIWIFRYQNGPYISAVTATNDLIDHKQAVPACITYMIASMLGFMICIPYWKILGLL